MLSYTVTREELAYKARVKRFYVEDLLSIAIENKKVVTENDLIYNVGNADHTASEAIGMHA